MTKNEIITELYKNKTVWSLIKNYNEKEVNLQDLEQDIYLILSLTNEDVLISMYENDKLLHWISATAKNQIKSKTSYYYLTYKKLQHISNNDKIDYI